MASRVIQPPAGPSKPLPAYAFIEDDLTKTMGAGVGGDILAGVLTVAPGRYIVSADWWVDSAENGGFGAVKMRVDGVDVTTPDRDARNYGFMSQVGFWISDGQAHTWTIAYLREGGVAVFGRANDRRWGRTIKLVGPLG